MYPHTLLPYDMRSHNILWNTTKCHDAPFSADALEKRFFPGGRLKAGLLACPDRNAFPIPSRNQWLETCRGTIEGLTAAGTAADSHGIPFSSRGGSTGLLANLDVTKIENKFVSLPPRTKKMLKIMKHAYVFPGQGAQAVGMGKDLYDNVPAAKELFEKANEILGFRITDIMFAGTDDQLKETKVTQPAVFLHSVISALCLGEEFKPAMVAGHSLGEFSALVAAGAMAFEDGLKLVAARANAMQKACEANPGTMAAIIGLPAVIALPDEKVEEICAEVSTEGNVVVAANYNCPGQLVISGNVDAINAACEKLKAAGAKRALPLKVGGAFHSPLMQPAKDELQAAIEKTTFSAPKCPVYQNVDGKPHTDPAEIQQNLIAQLTSSVRWTSSVQTMIVDADDFTECGPGKALQGMIGRIDKNVAAHGIA